MYIYIHQHTDAYTYIYKKYRYTYIYIYTHIFVHTYKHTHIYIYIYRSISTFLNRYIHRGAKLHSLTATQQTPPPGPGRSAWAPARAKGAARAPRASQGQDQAKPTAAAERPLAASVCDLWISMCIYIHMYIHMCIYTYVYMYTSLY